jgi:hypothetical protein
LRSYFVRIEIEKMPVAETVEQMLDALSMMPAAFQPEVDLEHRNVHGRIVVCFAFTVHAPTGHDRRQPLQPGSTRSGPRYRRARDGARRGD